MSALIIDDEQLVQDLLKRAHQEGRSIEEFLRLVVEAWPDTDTFNITDDDVMPDNDLSVLLSPPTIYPTLAEIIERGLAGGLENRADIGNSVEYVQQLRRKLWERQP